VGLFQDAIGIGEAAVGVATGNPGLVIAGAGTAGFKPSSSGLTADQTRRTNEMQNWYNLASGGDVATAGVILKTRFHATAYSKNLADQAWSALLVSNPQVAQAALQQFPQTDPANTDPGVMSRVKSELDSLVAKLRSDVATSVQRVGAGAATGAATSIDPKTGRVTLPLSSSAIWVVVLVALALGAVYFLAKKRA
jgi:hypothetical protein